MLWRVLAGEVFFGGGGESFRWASSGVGASAAGWVEGADAGSAGGSGEGGVDAVHHLRGVVEVGPGDPAVLEWLRLAFAVGAVEVDR
jgi:hypothetical protein